MVVSDTIHFIGLFTLKKLLPRPNFNVSLFIVAHKMINWHYSIQTRLI